jgi:hypothetical protein
MEEGEPKAEHRGHEGQEGFAIAAIARQPPTGLPNARGLAGTTIAFVSFVTSVFKAFGFLRDSVSPW